MRRVVTLLSVSWHHVSNPVKCLGLTLRRFGSTTTAAAHVARPARNVLGVVILLTALTACSTQESVTGAAKTTSTPSAETVRSRVWTDDQKPPPFTLHYANGKLDIKPYSYCYDNVCAEGIRAKTLPSIGSPESIVVELGLKDWKIEATFGVPDGGDPYCSRSQSTTLKPNADGLYPLTPLGRAGTYDVDLFGHGKGGDVAGSFRWQTPTDGPLATPSAVMALIADHDGKPDSYGFELILTNLATTPETVSATIKVTAANGQTLTLTPRVAGPGCRSDGNVTFTLADNKARAAGAIGGLPFTYDVTIVLDGTRYRATAKYPDDEITGNEPNVALGFSPALPALK